MTRFVVLFLFIALLNHVSAAAGTDQPFPLSLQQAQENAMKNHPRITQAELAALASKEVVRESRSGFFPVITAQCHRRRDFRRQHPHRRRGFE